MWRWNAELLTSERKWLQYFTGSEIEKAWRVPPGPPPAIRKCRWWVEWGTRLERSSAWNVAQKTSPYLAVYFLIITALIITCTVYLGMRVHIIYFFHAMHGLEGIGKRKVSNLRHAWKWNSKSNLKLQTQSETRTTNSSLKLKLLEIASLLQVGIAITF